MALPQSRRLDFSEIPILDVGPLVAGDHDPTLINALHRACADVGFLYVRNHGVSMGLISVISGARHSRLRKSLLNPIHPGTSKAWFIIHLSIRQTLCRQVMALQAF